MRFSKCRISHGGSLRVVPVSNIGWQSKPTGIAEWFTCNARLKKPRFQGKTRLQITFFYAEEQNRRITIVYIQLYHYTFLQILVKTSVFSNPLTDLYLLYELTGKFQPFMATQTSLVKRLVSSKACTQQGKILFKLHSLVQARVSE